MAKRPNILIFMTDHQRGDTALPENGCKTPNLDAFAREAVTFTETYCPSPHCCPSRATFMSGLYPSGHGVWNNVCNDLALSRGLKDDVRLWSEDLREAGYDLHWLGKWHVSAEEEPGDRGWTEHGRTSCTGRDHHGTHWEQYKRIAANEPPTERGEGQIVRPGYETYNTYGVNDGNQHDVGISEAAVDLIPELAQGDKPWVLFVGATGPHDPYFVPQKFRDMYDLDDIPLPDSYGDEMRDKPVIYQRMRDQVFGQLTEREVRETIRHFWAYCSFLDDLFGKILSSLDRTGQKDDTLVLYTADHGDYCGDHGLLCKGIPNFRGAYHVPALVRWPAGVANPGRREDAFVSLADFAPTFLDLAGVQTERHFTGASLKPFLQGETPADWRDDIQTQCNGVELYFHQRGVRTKDWKYTFNGFDWDELYDLNADPDEMRNLAKDPQYKEVIRDMCRRLWRFGMEEDDAVGRCQYITVGLFPFGPAEAFRADEGAAP